MPSAPYSRTRLLFAALGSLTQGTSLRITNFVGENEHRVDDAPDDRTDSACDEADNQLRDTKAGVAEVNAADADKAEQARSAEAVRRRSWTCQTVAHRSADGDRTERPDPCRPAGIRGPAADIRAAAAHNPEVAAGIAVDEEGAEVPRCHRTEAQSWHPACQNGAIARRVARPPAGACRRARSQGWTDRSIASSRVRPRGRA